jgi:hypothetical protein
MAKKAGFPRCDFCDRRHGDRVQVALLNPELKFGRTAVDWVWLNPRTGKWCYNEQFALTEIPSGPRAWSHVRLFHYCPPEENRDLHLELRPTADFYVCGDCTKHYMSEAASGYTQIPLPEPSSAPSLVMRIQRWVKRPASGRP